MIEKLRRRRDTRRARARLEAKPYGPKPGDRLHSATCGARPSIGSGGYDHWYCQRSRHHVGPHRFNNYVWSRLIRRHCRFRPRPIDLRRVAR